MYVHTYLLMQVLAEFSACRAVSCPLLFEGPVIQSYSRNRKLHTQRKECSAMKASVHTPWLLSPVQASPCFLAQIHSKNSIFLRLQSVNTDQWLKSVSEECLPELCSLGKLYWRACWDSLSSSIRQGCKSDKDVNQANKYLYNIIDCCSLGLLWKKTTQ